MKQLSKKELFFASLMLFSLYFGAGNLIFPPFMGQMAGTSSWIALLGFIVSSVGLPVLGITAVVKAGGLQELSSRVHPRFAIIFSTIIILAIGPFLAIPRAASLAFEMGVDPFLPATFAGSKLSLFIYTLFYFLLSLWFSLTPGKLVDRFGKIVTPILLGLIAIIFIFSLVKPIGLPTSPTGLYVESPFIEGVLQGYLTMDALAALNFGIVIAVTLRQLGLRDEKMIVRYSIKSAIIAGIFLAIVYAILTFFGAIAGGMFGATENGAQTLAQLVLYLFGQPGVIILGLVFTLACLTTSVGLIMCCAQYFSKLLPQVSYRAWAVIVSAFGLFLSNLGLTKILAISGPVLAFIYPMAIVLVLAFLADKWFNGRRAVYVGSVIAAGFVSLFDALQQFGFTISGVESLLSYLPFYTDGLGWILPAFVGALLGALVKNHDSLLQREQVK